MQGVEPAGLSQFDHLSVKWVARHVAEIGLPVETLTQMIFDDGVEIGHPGEEDLAAAEFVL